MTFYPAGPKFPHNLESWAASERAKRITRLIEKPRCMTPEAATIVIDAAMFGIGCLEGTVRAKIELDKQAKKA